MKTFVQFNIYYVKFGSKSRFGEGEYFYLYVRYKQNDTNGHSLLGECPDFEGLI